MDVLRTPDERFADLPGWPYAPRYADLEGLRMHYVDEGPADADPVLLLHGEPTWSYLYRHMIPPITAAGHRVVAPDMIGFGRSDKPRETTAHSYARHVGWMRALVEALDLERITLVCQDWGGLIGLRLVAEHPERFARVVAANTALVTGDQEMPEVWHRFRGWIRTSDPLPVERTIQAGTVTELPAPVLAAYGAPFPDEDHKAGPRVLPELVPTTPEDPETAANRRAWATLCDLDLPFLTAFGDSDPITGGAAEPMRRRFKGARGQPHTTIPAAGHFIQEDAGERLAEVVNAFIAST